MAGGQILQTVKGTHGILHSGRNKGEEKIIKS